MAWKKVDAITDALISRTHGHHLVHKVGAAGLDATAAAANAKSQKILEIFMSTRQAIL